MTPIRYLWELFYDMYRKIWRSLFRFSSLRRVGCTGRRPQEAILANTRCDQLTQVSCYSQVFFQDLIAVLIHARLLQRLTTFGFYGTDVTSPTPSGIIEPDCLHTLEVQFRRAITSTLLNHIICPSLRHLPVFSQIPPILSADSFLGPGAI